jgi:hypothetical protein
MPASKTCFSPRLCRQLQGLIGLLNLIWFAGLLAFGGHQLFIANDLAWFS